MKPRMILLTANWCSPCKKIKTQLGGLDLPNLEIIDIESDEGVTIVEKCKVKSIPTIVIGNPGKAFYKVLLRDINQLSKLYEETFNSTDIPNSSLQD